MAQIANLLMIFFSILGVFDATYLTYEELMGLTPPCAANLGFDCGAVLRSEWSHLGPIPLSLFGAGYYATMLILGIYLLVAPPNHPWHHLARLAVRVFSTFGLLFSAFLVYLMGVILEAWCLYCLVSAAACVLIFLSTWSYLAASKEIKGAE